MLGYFNDLELTLRAFTPDGWFRTGDMGKLYKGYLIVTGRMIETIITSEGMTLSPQQIEHSIKESPFVNEVVVKQVRSSNGRLSLVAMIVPDFEQVRFFAELKEIKANTPRELCDHPDIRELIRSDVGSLTRELMPGEGVEVALSSREFTHHEGDLTITDKLKRDAAFDKRYQELAQSAD
jgi:long-chain acyl-CoA synthetase